MMEKSLKLRTREGQYNLLAELLSDTNAVSIKIARFRGQDKAELDEKSEYGYQCLLRAIDRMTDRLEAENYTLSKIEGARRKDKRLMDMSSLREAFINAIAHNDWTICPPAVYVFSDRIEIFSYGGLPLGQTKEMFFKGASNPRNVSLMRILSDLEYVEQTGHGIPEIIRNYGREAFEINDNYINVTIPFDKEVMESHAKNLLKGDDAINDAINENEKSVILAINEKPTITREDLSQKIGKSTATVYRVLNSLQEKGIIKRIGSKKNGHWEIKK